MNPEAGQAWFRVATFITLVAAVLLLYAAPGTAEFVITVASLVMGLLFMALIVLLVKFGSR